MSNFNYSSLVWNFSSAQSLNKIGNLQKKTLHIMLNDYDSTYEDLLKKSGYLKMNKKKLCAVTITMICSNLPLIWEFQSFRRLLYNPVEHL